jgi:hypothetical protein
MTIFKRYTGFFVFVVLMFCGSRVWAEEFVGIRALGLGGALRAAPTGSAALFLNPAGMSLMRSYVVEGDYEYRVRRQGHVAHVGVVDSITSKYVAAGLYYNFFYSRPKVYEPTMEKNIKLAKQGHQAGLAVSVPLGTYFILGANARYQYFQTVAKVRNADTGEPEDYDVEKINTAGVDVGAIVRISDYLNIGVVGTNLIPTESTEAPLQLATGLAFKWGKHLLADVDVVLDFDVPERKKMVNVHGGVEGFFADHFTVRAGTFYRTYWDAVYVSGGFAYVSPKVAIDAACSQQVSGGVETQFGFSLRVFFN